MRRWMCSTSEPLAPGHELATLPNVTLSAHSAFRTPEASENLIRRALDIAKALRVSRGYRCICMIRSIGIML